MTAGLLRFDEPVGATPRASLIVLAGRGEAASVYTRLGRRLSADAYRVTVVPDVTRDPTHTAALVRGLIADSDPAPVVVVGSDAGSVLALQLASEPGSRIAALVTAGLPVNTSIEADAAALIEARSACPVHRVVLADRDAVDPLALARELPAELRLPHAADVTVPVLAVHGEADVVAAIAGAETYYADLADGRLARVPGGRHDILNDVTHRSVAATIVLFVEELRVGAPTIAVTAPRSVEVFAQ